MMERVDLAFLDITSLREVPGLRLESLCQLKGRYVCRAGHPLLALGIVGPEDVRKYPMALPRVAHQHGSWMQVADSGMTVDVATGSVIPSIAVSSCRLMYEIVAASDTISVAHPSQVRTAVENGRLVLFDLPWLKTGPAARFGMIHRQDRTLPPSGRLLLDAVRKVIRTL
jgi:DNA-binding transcriptional LysR family regulator